MSRFILLLLLISFISCDHTSSEGKYYSHLNWKKYRKDYDFGLLRDKPKEVKENLYINLDDTTLNAGGEQNGFEKYKFNSDGEITFWEQYKSDSSWFIGEMNYDKNGLQARYYSNKDSLKTFENVSKVISTKLAKDRYLMHSFFNVGPAFMLVSSMNEGNIIKKEFIIDSLKQNEVLKTVNFYYQNELVQRVETNSDKGFKQLDKYYYSSVGHLDSIHKIIMDNLMEREIFVNNANGDPVNYSLLRGSNGDTLKHIVMQYAYDNHKNWVKRLENKIKGDYALSGKNVHYSLVKREIIY